jgi:hypothetical protein
MRTDQPITIRRLDYTPPAYTVDRIDLRFELDPRQKRAKLGGALTAKRLDLRPRLAQFRVAVLRRAQRHRLVRREQRLGQRRGRKPPRQTIQLTAVGFARGR